MELKVTSLIGSILIILRVIINVAGQANYTVVNTNNGPVGGFLAVTLINNTNYYSFKGIRYAKPMIGKLRFLPPIPADSWAPTVYNATQFGSKCVQMDGSGNEDCLFLNINVPAVRNGLFAVMVFIHGGGYNGGSGDSTLYGPDFLILKGNGTYSGNMGAKDQQLALKWVNQNIRNFGGDPNRITVMGESTGGASAHFQALCPASSALFQRLICLSGTANSPWAMSPYPNNNAMLFKVADDFNQSQTTLDGLVKFLQEVPANKLAVYGVTPVERTGVVNYAMVVEPPGATNTIVTSLPCDTYDTTKVNLDALFSTTTLEYLTFYLPVNKAVYNLSDLNSFRWKYPFSQSNITIQPYSAADNCTQEQIREEYFGDGPINELDLFQYLKLLSYMNFGYPTDRVSIRQAAESSSDTYRVLFGVETPLNIGTLPVKAPFEVTAHADDLCYVFCCGLLQDTYNSFIANRSDPISQIAFRAIDATTTLYSNFAKYGTPINSKQPVPSFPPVNGSQINFLNITNNGLVLGVNPDPCQFAFWQKVELETTGEIQCKVQ